METFEQLKHKVSIINDNDMYRIVDWSLFDYMFGEITCVFIPKNKIVNGMQAKILVEIAFSMVDTCEEFKFYVSREAVIIDNGEISLFLTLLGALS